MRPAWERHRPVSIAEGGWEVHAASDIPYPGRHIPVALDEAGISSLLDDYHAAAQRAAYLELDFIEIHAAHGYLLHNFMSPLTNNRVDRYGGSFENRIRLLLEIYETVGRAFSKDKPIGSDLGNRLGSGRMDVRRECHACPKAEGFGV